MYTLKENQPKFTVMDGPFAAKQFKHGEKYAEVPPELAQNFDTVDEGTQGGDVTQLTEEVRDEKLYS